MSQIVAIKYDKGILLGADTKVSFGGDMFCNANKIFKSNIYDIAFGVVGSVRDANIVEYNVDNIIDIKDFAKGRKNLDKKYVVTDTIPRLFSYLRDNHRLKETNGIEESLSEYILCDIKHIFIITSDGSVVELDKYGTVGCGTEKVWGYLDTLDWNKTFTKNKAEEIIKNAILKSCKRDYYISDDNVTFIDLVDSNS